MPAGAPVGPGLARKPPPRCQPQSLVGVSMSDSPWLMSPAPRKPVTGHEQPLPGSPAASPRPRPWRRRSRRRPALSPPYRPCGVPTGGPSCLWPSLPGGGCRPAGGTVTLDRGGGSGHQPQAGLQPDGRGGACHSARVGGLRAVPATRGPSIRDPSMVPGTGLGHSRREVAAEHLQLSS